MRQAYAQTATGPQNIDLGPREWTVLEYLMLQAPKPLRLVKLLSVISVKGAVRYIEVEEGGVVRTASVGELVGGWKIAAATPDGIRLISSKSVAVELKPGESMEVK